MSIQPAHRRFVRRIDDLINESEKTQRQIALELGYDNQNIISMFKTGCTRVPLGKVPALATALGTDRRDLVLAWMQAYEPEMLAILRTVFEAE